MNWAGVHSENLASVWLLYHLCDFLSADQFKEVAGQLGLLRRERNNQEEPYNLYRTRIRDKYGIVLNRSVLEQASFNVAVKNLETDFLFENRMDEYSILKNLHYGLNFDKYEEGIENSLLDEELKESARKELELRRDLLKINYLSLVKRQEQFRKFQFYLKNREEELDPFYDPLLQLSGALYFDQKLDRYNFVDDEFATNDMALVDTDRLIAYLASKSSAEQEKFWEDVLLDSTISSAAFTLAQEQVKREFRKLLALPPYSIEVLAGVKDFRILVGLLYLVEFGREMGISSQLEPVLSFPLGSNVVTLLETVRMYEGLITGKVSLAGEKGTRNQDLMSVLDRIETTDGEVVYQTKTQQKTLVAPKVQVVLDNILENTITFGTGRFAKNNTRLPQRQDDKAGLTETLDLVIPLLGKTGTANSYTNASFFGYLPGPSKGGTGMVIDSGYSLGVYVGFDDNKVMRRKTTRITGAAGALPAWTDLVNMIMQEKGYAERLDPVDLSFYGLTLLHDELGQMRLAVDKNRGGQITIPPEKVDRRNRLRPSILTFGDFPENGRFEPERLFAPFWGGDDHLLETDL